MRLLRVLLLYLSFYSVSASWIRHVQFHRSDASCNRPICEKWTRTGRDACEQEENSFYYWDCVSGVPTRFLCTDPSCRNSTCTTVPSSNGCGSVTCQSVPFKYAPCHPDQLEWLGEEMFQGFASTASHRAQILIFAFVVLDLFLCYIMAH
eukprot:TRINITY_DN3471_c0_g1_i3.p1 TRINITY_DN3471_c0_g1~~TRINITY_DN3471_c0_g1_i3.p1  ORF type:complete len:150 (+),score=6.03 TRINITY_DN3471_c0_g1_i3:257-706(+)